LTNSFSRIAFIIVSYNSYNDLKLYLTSFLKFNDITNVDFYIIETNPNHCLQDLEALFSDKLNLSIRYIQNKGYGSACNYGYSIAKQSNFDLIVFSNPDIVFNCNILDKLRDKFNINNYGTIIQRSANNKNCTFDLYPQYKCFLTEIFHAHKLINTFNMYNPKFTYIVGAFMIFGRNIIDFHGPFDEKYFLYYEETDFFFRIRDKSVPVIIDDIFITHNISTSIDSNQSINKFSIQIDSLYYYSKKFGTFRYMKSLILLYKATSLFTNKHNAKLKLLLSKKI